MPLTLVLGPANSAKAGEVLGAYAAAARRGAILVVPTVADAEHYGRELAEEGCVLGSVLTFAGLAAEIARRAGYDGRRLTQLQRERVLRRVIRATEPKNLERAAQTPGFAFAAGDLIAELQRSLVTPQRFTQALRTWAEEDPRREPYATDVASIYMRYARELERLGRVDRELHAWRALDALRASPGRWGSDAVFFYGFDDLHPLERDAVETLSRVAGAEVTISLTYEAGRTALQARAEVVEELRPLAQRVLELPALDTYYEPDSRAALHHLERSIFESTERADERIDPGPAVRLLEAGGARAEAELVGAEVLELLRDGVAAEEIVIVYRSLIRVAPLLERVFEQYGIPIAIESELPFADTAFGRGLLGLARCALLGEQRARAEDLLAYLRSPGVLDQPELADRLEAEVRREVLRTAAQARERLGWSLQEIDALSSASDPAAELARQGRWLLAASGRGRAPVFDRQQQLDARALATMLRALAELEQLGESPGAAELLELLEELRLPAGTTPAANAVLVSEPLAIRARRFRAVFVCGLQEGAFPLPSAPEPFFPDERRRELAASSGLRLRHEENALARERYLFYSCLSRASERLFFSYTSADEEGNLALPSPFLADVSALLIAGWPERRRRRLLADVVWPPREAPTSRELARSLAAAAPISEVPSPLGPLSETAMAHVRHKQIVSGGALETYAACPVKWLVERELQPPRFGPQDDPIARGNYMHEAMEAVLRELGRAVSPESLSDALRLLDTVLEELPVVIAPGRPEGVRAGAIEMIRADLRRYLEHEAADDCDWEPQGLELAFGFEDEEGSLPALALGEGSDRIYLRGVVDRVDVDPGSRRAIVRDYKSGGARTEYQGARWRSDRQLQVALYMLAVRELMGLEPVAGLYQPLGGRDLRARGMYLEEASLGCRLVSNDAREGEALRDELEQAAARAIALAARLRVGELEPCPETCSRDGCRYPEICRLG